MCGIRGRMAGILLSEAEKTYILHGIRNGLRNDGRSCADFRPIELELGLVVHANGSANATPQFEGKGGDELATSLASLLARAYQSKAAFDLRPLSIIKGSKCWKLCVDILLEDSLVVDASAEEEACCAAALICAVTPQGRITATCLPGHGSFLYDAAALPKALKLAGESGMSLNAALHAAIEKHVSTPRCNSPRGFIHS
ncbi:hypothetical protein B566_EDAN017131 [Ephemera danica]|nr:hypothetical protein B566_EDAN017131 [Ephemera danica]